MEIRRSHFAFSPLTSLLTYTVLAGMLGAPCLAQQPPAAPDGQGAPQGEGQRRFFRGNGVVGRIESLAPGEMKLATPDGATATVHLNSKTEFRKDQQPAKIEEFKVGMNVFVRGTKSSDGSWEAEGVSARTGGPGMGMEPGTFRMEIVAGTVKAIDGTAITVLGLDNTTTTVAVDENTSLRKRRESITLADIHPGDSVMIRGETKDGAFVPKALNIVDPEQLQRMRQFMGPGGPPPGSAPAPAGQTPPPNGKPPQEHR